MPFQSALFFESVEEIYGRVFRDLRPSLSLPKIEVRFCRFTSATSRIRYAGGVLGVQISDLLESAPSPVQESLAYILLSKLFRQRVPAPMMSQYRLYLRRPDMQNRIDSVRKERGAKRLMSSSGSHYDLETLFDRVNAQYFGGSIPRPRLGWSKMRSRTILGHYDPAHHAIVLSSILDQSSVPEFLVEYVLFHEALHIKHPTDGSGARRRIHTSAFRAEEKTFPRYAEVRQAMKSLR